MNDDDFWCWAGPPGAGGDSAAAKVVVCTFATPAYMGSAALLRHTALDVGGADAVKVYEAKDVEPLFAQYPELLAGATRGYGWWAWKAWCILHALDHVRPNDVVVYCDSTMMVEAPLAPLAEAVEDVLLFRLGGCRAEGYTNERWTKRDAFALMGRTSAAHREAYQLNAAVQAYRNTPAARAFAEEYLRHCVQRQIVDDACALANYPGFREHRHDQSVLSVLAVGCPAVRVGRDPTQWARDDDFKDDEDPPPPPPPAPLFNHHRQLRRPARVAVITPTTGGRHLGACVASVQRQELPNVDHYVIVDGPEHEGAVRAALAPHLHRKPIHVVVLPQNVGSDGWNGHRVYGAFPWLIDADFVAYLDDDNEMDPDHLRVLLRDIAAAGVPWGYSLRRIIDQDGKEVCPDNCESLGGICPTVLCMNDDTSGAATDDDRLIDTSCYLISRDLAIQASPVWNARFRDSSGRPEPDRALARALLSAAPHACVRRHSLRYRVGSTGRSVGADFFLRGNEAYGYDFSGRQDLYVFHFNPRATRQLLALRRRRDRSYALDEWQMTLLRGLDAASGGGGGGGERFNLLDGYACAPNIPPGARVLACLCRPEEAPLDFLGSRPDLVRVAYTLESPNIRHAAQWSPALLGTCFDAVLTYADFLLREMGPDRAVFCPHNTHTLDLSDPLDLGQLRENRGAGRSCVMVLENRAGLAGRYEVPDTSVVLECLDPWREALVRDLEDVTVYGQGWDAAARRNPNLKLGHALHRSADPRHAVDIIQGYTFVIIVENCDVEWYASEKLYDALLAGALPLYYGNVPPQLGIPEGAESGLYVDLKKAGIVVAAPGGQAECSSRLRAFIAGLTDAQIAAWKARVASQRLRVLAQVDTSAFARRAREALALAAAHKGDLPTNTL